MARILLADDEPAVREAIGRILEREGHEVLSASDGVVATELLRVQSIDLAIIDIFMPNLDGMELTALLRRHMQSVKILAVSGGGVLEKEDVLELASRFGADRTLPKPFDPEELIGAVRELLAEREITP